MIVFSESWRGLFDMTGIPRHIFTLECPNGIYTLKYLFNYLGKDKKYACPF
jgi:hypothetical protein